MLSNFPTAAAMLAGFASGLALIVAIGAQNAFILRIGLTRTHVLPVILVCMFSDVLLITAGVAGLGALVHGVPWLLPVAKYVGAAFLIGYAIFAVRRAFHSQALVTASDDDGETGNGGQTGTPRKAGLAKSAGVGASIATVLALTWLNPHVYLDTVLLLGSLSTNYGNLKWFFGLGAMISSILWFFALGYGARVLTPVFAKPVAWKILDILIAVVMVGIAITLLVER